LFLKLFFLSIFSLFMPVNGPWAPTMDEGSKGIRHGGGGAYLRCPVLTTVHFSLRDEGSSEYIQVCEGRESLRPNF
jgi:hypothetical protein